MKSFFTPFLFLFFILFSSTVCFSQSTYKIDSLENELQKSIDTTKVNVLNALAIAHLNKTPATSLEYSTKALLLSKKIDFQKGIGISNINMGAVYFDRGDFNKALEFYITSLKTNEGIDYKKGIVKSLNNIGDVYVNQGFYEKALINYLRSEQICETIGDKKSMQHNNIAASYFYLGNYEKALRYYIKALETAETFGNKMKMFNPTNGVGNVYYNMKDYEKALIFYKKALALSSEVKNQKGIAKSLTTIGNVYEKLQNNDTALDYHIRSLQINEKLGEKQAIALSLMNIGNIYTKTKKYEKALEYYGRALIINKETGSKNGSAQSLFNIGLLYSKKGNIDKAMEYFKKGLTLANSIKIKEIMSESNLELSEVYVKKDDYKNAYTYYKRHALIKDSILNEDKAKIIADMSTKYGTEQKEKENELLTKEKSLLDEKSKNQQFIIIGFVVGIFLVLLLAFLAYNRYRDKQKASEVISQINKEINQSITYAKRIQTSFLTSEKYIAQHLSDYFISFAPRNVVSGDFYWLMEKENLLYVCTADCTGHGIPGAFMSLIGMGVLNEIIYSKTHISHTDEIFNELRRIIILAVNPIGASEEGRDGMDAVLCRYDLQKMELEYSAANSSFYIVRNGELLVFKPDKMPVGKHIGVEKPFTRSVIPIYKGDCIYTFSDGYADQFGGPQNKKFQSKQMKELLLANSNKSMSEQKELLDKRMEQWKGDHEQVDDILVIGIRV